MFRYEFKKNSDICSAKVVAKRQNKRKLQISRRKKE